MNLEFLTLIKSASIFYTILALSMNLIVLVILAIRYKILLKHMNEKISTWHSLLTIFVSQFASYITPFKIGVAVVRPIATKEFSGIPIKKSFFIIVFEQIFELGWQMLVFPILLLIIGETLLINSAITKAIIFLVTISLLLIVIIKYEYFLKLVWNVKTFMPSYVTNKVKKVITKKQIDKMLADILKCLKTPKFTLSALIPTLFVFIISPLMLQFSGYAFNENIGYITAFLAYWIGMILGRLSGLPGGIGVRDVTSVGILVSFGIPALVSLKIMILYRIIAALPHVIIGAPIFFQYGKKLMLKSLKK